MVLWKEWISLIKEWISLRENSIVIAKVNRNDFDIITNI
jgi:hypothetical protein